MFDVERWLEVFREDITFVVLTCDSPNSHLAVDVILSDCVMSSAIERECSFIVGCVAMCSAA